LGIVRSSNRPVGFAARDVATSFGSVAGIPTYVQEIVESPPNPGNNFCKSAIGSGALIGTGCSRADSWRSETSLSSSTALRLAGTTVSGHTESRFRLSRLVLTEETSKDLPARCRLSCENGSLPGLRGLPMSIHRCVCDAGHSRVRYILCRLFGPLQKGVNPSATFPSE